MAKNQKSYTPEFKQHLEKAELTLIRMPSKTKKVITTPPPVLCSVASYKLFYTKE